MTRTPAISHLFMAGSTVRTTDLLRLRQDPPMPLPFPITSPELPTQNEAYMLSLISLLVSFGFQGIRAVYYSVTSRATTRAPSSRTRRIVVLDAPYSRLEARRAAEQQTEAAAAGSADADQQASRKADRERRRAASKAGKARFGRHQRQLARLRLGAAQRCRRRAM